MAELDVRPRSAHPLEVSSERYAELTHQRGPQGWSQCADQLEWLCKLHYLRQGRASGKLEEEDFLQREARLVATWIRNLR